MKHGRAGKIRLASEKSLVCVLCVDSLLFSSGSNSAINNSNNKKQKARNKKNPTPQQTPHKLAEFHFFADELYKRELFLTRTLVFFSFSKNTKLM